jgi:PAS domain S-box-containing protein
MPEMNGIAFLKALRASGNTTPFIIFTGRGREEVVIEAINSGADFYLQKGGDPKSQFAELAHKIRHAISQKRADVALKKSEQDYRYLIEHANEAIYVVQDGYLRMVNPQTLELTEYSEHELLNQPFTTFVHPDDCDMLLTRFRKRIDGKTPLSRYMFRLIRKTGTVRWGELSVVAITWDGCPATLNFLTDVTERKHAEDALRESEARYREFFKTTRDGVFITTPVGQFIDFNDALVKALGCKDREEVFSLDVASTYAYPEERDIFLDLVRKDGYINEYPLKFRKQGGAVIDTIITIVPLKNPDGSVKAFIGTVRDITERKRTEDNLQKSEERYRRIFESIEDLYYQTDINGLFSILSPSVYRLTGWTPEELIGKPATTLYAHPEKRTDLLADIATHGHVWDYELLLLDKAGTSIPTSLSANRISNPDGTHVGFAGVIRNISQRKHAEDALRESERRYHAVVEDQTELICRFHPDGTHAFVNEAYCRYFGLDREEIIGSRFRPEIHPDDNEPVRRFFESLTPENPVDMIEHRIILPDGSIRWQQWSDRAIFGADGNVTEFQSVGRDITHRKKVEFALENSEHHKNAIIAAMPDTLVVLSRDGIYHDYHSNDERVRSLHSGDIIGTNIRNSKISPEAVEKILQTISLSIDTGTLQKIEYDILHHSGCHRIEARFIRLDRGRVLGVVRDITEHKQAEETIRQSNRKLNLLSSITRHDINNQLTVMIGYLLIFEKMQPAFASNECLQKIEIAAKRISSMIEFTREYEKIGVNAPAWQDIRNLVEQVIKDVSTENVSVNNNLHEKSEIFADPLVTRVVYNLMDNAVRHGGKITTIRFFMDEHNGNPIMVCEDDGDGIPLNEKEKIFERGFGKNTGLGLAISQEILSITGMTITETGEPGKGARFEIVIPKGKYRVASDNS